MVLGSQIGQSRNWFETNLGSRLQAAAAKELVRIVPRVYFSVALDLGPGTIKYFQHLDTGLDFRINPFGFRTKVYSFKLWLQIFL